MIKANDNIDEHITVIPYYSHCAANFQRIKVRRLFFWHNNTFDHPVNDATLANFLLHVKLFGATVYPDCPELGCIAIDCDQSLDKGESTVSEISYKGEVIYCRS